MDNDVHDVLTKLELPNVRLIQLSKLETRELLALKPTHSIGEYYSTSTPFRPRFVIETDPEVLCVTYLGTYMWFKKIPIKFLKTFKLREKNANHRSRICALYRWL